MADEFTELANSLKKFSDGLYEAQMLFGIKQAPTKKVEKNQVQMSLEENSICNLLKDGERDFDYLQEKTGLSTQNLNISLTSLEISGIIKKLSGNSYVLIS